MREWLIIIVVLLLAGVLLDGLRRVRRGKRSGASGHSARAAAREEYSRELPNGGARVVDRRDPDDARQLYRQMRERREGKQTSPRRKRPLPEQVSLNLDEQVPMLMEVEEEEEEGEPPPSESGEQAIRADSPTEPNTTNTEAQPESGPNADDPEENLREAEEVLVINVMAPRGEKLAGEPLLKTVLEHGMRFGHMDIFHRHAGTKGQGPVLYSMANIVVPGTFELEAMENFTTPGVSFFLTLPMETDSGRAFEQMLGTARAVARNLDGELKDENRSVLTPQTVEHYRNRIRDFQRRQLSRGTL